MSGDVQRRVVITTVWSQPFGVACTGRDSFDALHRFLVPPVSGRPSEGEVWEFCGPIIYSQEYGVQMHVTQGRPVSPSGRLLIRYLAEHDAFRVAKIGTGRARALWAHFGAALFDVLDSQNSSSLSASGCVPEASVRPLLEAWQAQRDELSVIRWLQDNCFPARLGRKLISVYGSETVAKLEKNPYRLLAFCSFTECERVARAVGIPLDDERRLVAIAQQVLFERLAHGHTLLRHDALVRRVATIVGGSDLAEQAVRSACSQRLISQFGTSWGLMGIRSLEASVEIALEARSTPESQQSFAHLEDETVRDAVARFRAEAQFDLNPEQQIAVKLAVNSKLAVICGGAGVGKTTVLRAIAVAMPRNVWFMSVTGQAARRISEATRCPATTIARFLHSLVGQIQRDSTPLIVVDEASMLDLPTTARLLRALPSDARLLLVGDPHQLPPIGFGLIYHRLVGAPLVPQIELTVINRQKGETGIPQVSLAVRSGRLPDLRVFAGEAIGVFAERCDRVAILDRLIALRRDLPLSQILCPKNAGGVGVADVNTTFHALESAGKERHQTLAFAVGDPVIYKKNDISLGLVNGSLGSISRITPDGVLCDFDRELKMISGENLEHLKLSYGLTVHSAQGSQFSDVIVVVERSKVLDRTWVYTAITRAVKRIILVGDMDALADAIKNPPSASTRHVGFALTSEQRRAAA